MVVLYCASPLHLHHTSLDAPVVNVTEVLHVFLHTVSHKVRGGGSEAALGFLKVLMIPHLKSTGKEWAHLLTETEAFLKHLSLVRYV